MSRCWNCNKKIEEATDFCDFNCNIEFYKKRELNIKKMIKDIAFINKQLKDILKRS